MSHRVPTEELALRAKAGDQDAIRNLVVRFSSRLERFVRSRVGAALQSKLDPEDVVQESFAKAFQVMAALEWRGETAFFRWLASIAENVILNASKKTALKPLKFKAEFPGEGTSPSRKLRRNERFDRFQKALDGLSEEHRQVILLVRIERLKVEEIARRMGRSPNAVKKLLARALEELKKAFGETESLHLPPKQFDPGE